MLLCSQRKDVILMPKCVIGGGDIPKQPCITEEGNCDLCGRKVVLEEEKKKKKIDAICFTIMSI
jgi:hypothetical protein